MNSNDERKPGKEPNENQPATDMPAANHADAHADGVADSSATAPTAATAAVETGRVPETASADGETTAETAAEADDSTLSPADSIQFSVIFDEDESDDDTDADGQNGAAAAGDIWNALDAAEADADQRQADDKADAANDQARTVADHGGASADGESGNAAQAKSGIAATDTSAEATAENARRVNETLSLAKTDEQGSELERHAESRSAAEPTSTLASRIDRVLVGGSADEVLLKTYPTFALNKVTVPGAKGRPNVLDATEFACYAGHVYALLVTDGGTDGSESDAASSAAVTDIPSANAKRQALMAVMTGLIRPASGSVMNKSANIAELEPVELRGHRLGIVPQRHALQPDLDAERNVLYAMNASNRNFLKPKPVIARELLAQIGFSEATSGMPVGKLPEVQQRLAAIARAISTEAEVLILDEPTQGLNEDDTVTVLAALAKLAHSGDPKHCVIVVTASREIAGATDQFFEI